VPTIIQEIGEGARAIESKVDDLAALPEQVLTQEEVEEVAAIGNNKGCMDLKGGNPGHQGEPLPDRWAINSDLAGVAKRWAIDPAKELGYAHATVA
jgi:hypothetical protein